MESITSSLLLTGAVVGLSFWAIYYHIKVFSFWSSRGVKGPTPIPFFGTSFHYMFKNRIFVDQDWYDKYGKVYGIYEGYTPVLRLADNELIKYVFIKNFKQFTDRNNLFIYGDNMRRWLLWSKGEHWYSQRVLTSPLFTSSKMRAMFSSMLSCANRFTREIQTRLISSFPLDQDDIEREKALSKAEATISRDEIMCSTLDVIALSFFGIKLDTYRDKTSDFFKRAYAFSSFNFPYFIFWIFLPSRIAKYLRIDPIPSSQYEYFDKLSQSTVNERRKNPNSSKHHDFIQALLDAKIPDKHEEIYSKDDDREAHYNDQVDHKELERQQIDASEKAMFRKFEDVEIRGQMTFFFLAGFETTSNSLTFCFYELAHQQAAQQELYEEMMNNDKFLDGTIDHNDVMNLKKLDAFVSEALRLYVPVLELNRLVTEKGGVVLPTETPIQLPEKTPIAVTCYQLQRNPGYWSKPDEFDMTRFYPENRHKINTCTYMPFGLGPRNCAGMRFAILNVKLTLTRCLLKYKVTPGHNTKQYPPSYNYHAFFLQLANTEFNFTPRQQAL